jgi:hypothetical protein
VGTLDRTLFIAGEPVSVDQALDRLNSYPIQTPDVYDLPGPGEPNIITAEEIARTRKVSSRISHAEAEWFIATGTSAPWVSIDADLRDADPGETGQLYDAMLALYNHFESSAPTGISTAKISKVLHLKRPKLFPILDSRLHRRYRPAASAEASRHPERQHRLMYWAAIRLDLLRSNQGLAHLRSRIADHPSENVQKLGSVSDLRLLDMVTW